MNDAELVSLAAEAGVEPRYRDAFGTVQEVAPDTLRAILIALGLPAHPSSHVEDGRAVLRAQEGGVSLPPLVTGDVGQPIALPVPPARFQITYEDGTRQEGFAAGDECAELPPLTKPGYHEIEIGSVRTTIANAPRTCHLPAARSWGLAVQLYSLRRRGDGGIGDFVALRELVRDAARHGAATVAISPVHAQFSADPHRFSPYAPSSRIALNVLHGDDSGLAPFADPPDALQARLETLDLVDWPAATRLRLGRYRRLYTALGGAHPEFAAWRSTEGAPVEPHAVFEALHARFFGEDPAKWHWRSWPEAFRDPQSPAVAAFAREHADEVTFHAFLQFLAARGLARAQQAAREAGMPIGLISDLAVGSDGGGSQAWSHQRETLLGLSIGAPPDLLNMEGQDWGLSAFSPLGLRQSGFAGFLEMLRAALRHAGGVRIDHVMGLARIWVLPEGAKPTEGAYIRLPLEDMLRLVALESQRHGAIVLGEDLGTLPDGFQDQLTARGVLGLRVLYFERDGEAFRKPRNYTPQAVAMTSTHDLAPVAGWWSGRDLDIRNELGLLGDEKSTWHEYENRARDRRRLWEAFQESGAVQGDGPPPPEETQAAVTASIRHIGGSACTVALVPVEDVLGLRDQPNLPGTHLEHPNWRRRLPAESVLDSPDAARRLSDLAQQRP